MRCTAAKNLKASETITVTANRGGAGWVGVDNKKHGINAHFFLAILLMKPSPTLIRLLKE
jgi:hypothetical protein